MALDELVETSEMPSPLRDRARQDVHEERLLILLLQAKRHQRGVRLARERREER
jgi:hypothetical protein